MNKILLLGCVALPWMTLTSCQSYKADPVNWEKESHAWQNSSRNNVQSSLSLAQAQQIGLMLSPELNTARIKYQGAIKEAEAAGYWQDPSIAFEFNQLFSNVPGSQMTKLGPSFTIPLTGLPRLEKKIANLYKEQDYWTVKELEMKFLCELEQAWLQWTVCQEKIKRSEQRANELFNKDAKFQRLMEYGEISLPEMQESASFYNEVYRTVSDLKNEASQQKFAILKMMGISPDLANQINLKPASLGGASLLTLPQSAIVQAPQLKTQLAKFDISEKQFLAEIKKQYPDLGLYAAIEKEGSNYRFSPTVDLTSIPLWNRNRAGVAAGETNRNVTRAETINLWKNLSNQLANNIASQRIIVDLIDRDSKQLVSDQKAADTLKKMYALGEAKLLDLSEATQRYYETKMSLLEQQYRLSVLKSSLKYLYFNQ